MKPVDPNETIIELSRRDLEDIIEGAAKRGAQSALNSLGLSDSDAVKDVLELRSLLSTWREARKTAMRTLVQTVTTAFLVIMVAGLAVKAGFLAWVSTTPPAP